MKKYTQLAIVGVLSGTLAACSSDSNNSSSTTTENSGTDTSSSTSTDSMSSTTGNPSNSDSTTAESAGVTENNASSEPTDSVDTATEPTDATGSSEPEDPTEGDTITPSGRSQLGNPPTLKDPYADAVASPSSFDPFGTQLEVDDEAPVAGGAPTTPKHLRVDLVSNDWAEINWAPANDDIAVVEYKIYRSDGHVYNIRPNDVANNSGGQNEIDKYWKTTSFIDCNFTRFSDSVHMCGVHGPSPGDTYSYQVTAVDAQGNESPRSNAITIDYHVETNAAVPWYDDIYKRPGDTFAQDHDLSNTAYFLDKFNLVFEDNFDGPAIDETKWNTGLTWGDTRIINGEQQYFVNTQAEPGFGYDPFKFENGDLIIEAIKTPPEFVDSLPPVCAEPDPTGNERCQFLSGALSSHDKFGITYGYVEGRMKAGNVSGMLSSFYLYHRYPGVDAFLHGPEIDILEYLGENPFGSEDAFQTYHFMDPSYSEPDNYVIRSAPTMFHRQDNGVNYGDGYHTFGVLWEPQLIIWYIDGVEVKRLTGVQVARQQMNIVAYLVAGSGWAPTPSDDDSIYPLQFKLDYVRAYQRPEYSNNGVYPSR